MTRKLMAVLVTVVTVLGLASLTPTSAQAGTPTSSRFFHPGYTQVVVAPDVYNLVASAGITPAPLDGAVAFPYKGTLAARFPITGLVLRSLTLTHSGGISLTAGSATIALSDFDINLSKGTVSAEVTGSIGAVGRVDVFTLGLSNRLDLGLVKLSLNGTSAGALNATFGVSAFAAGQTFGYATPRPFASLSSQQRAPLSHWTS